MPGLFSSGGRSSDFGDITVNGMLNIGTPPTLDIASGAVTVTTSYALLDTEGGGATDDLATINGGTNGDLLTLLIVNNAHVVTIKDGTGNLLTAGDFVMNSTHDSITLLRTATFWKEISRSDNN